MTVLSVFQRLNADEDLYALVFGESVRSPAVPDGMTPFCSCIRHMLSHDAVPISFHAINSLAHPLFQIQQKIAKGEMRSKSRGCVPGQFSRHRFAYFGARYAGGSSNQDS